ncbi:MAG: hypothetical protein AABZ55_12960 [Bdellovibrionota bacterium]
MFSKLYFGIVLSLFSTLAVGQSFADSVQIRQESLPNLPILLIVQEDHQGNRVVYQSKEDMEVATPESAETAIHQAVKPENEITGIRNSDFQLNSLLNTDYNPWFWWYSSWYSPGYGYNPYMYGYNWGNYVYPYYPSYFLPYGGFYYHFYRNYPFINPIPGGFPHYGFPHHR